MGLARVFVGAFMAAVLLAGCGGKSGVQQSEAGLQRAAREATEALFAGELRKAYESFSEECRDVTSFGEFSSSVTIARAFLEAFSGVKLADFKVTGVQVRNFTGTGGEVLIEVEAPGDAEGFGDDEWIAWMVEDGKWVQADCDDLGLDSDSGFEDPGSNGAVATVPPPGEGPPIGTAVEAGPSRYTVNGMEDPGPEDDFYQPDEGNRWVTFDITQEAVSGQASASPWDFTVQDEDGFIYEWTFGAKQPEFSSTQLAVGQRIRGFLTFEVPEDAVLVAMYADADFPRPPTMIADLTR
jgi:hypothetical protein